MTRTTLVTSPSGILEDVCRATSGRNTNIEGFSPEFQVSFPYRGFFVWHVEGDDVVADSNQILFVTGGEPFRLSTPRGGGYAELILTPATSTLSALTEVVSVELAKHPLFRARSRRATLAVQRACLRLLGGVSAEFAVDILAADEAILALLRAALETDPVRPTPSAPTRRLIRRTKEYLESAFTKQLRLGDVADAVGASPAYLTDVFSRYEGVSLQRYVKKRRLARALTELPHTDDLTALALDLGFSSHSHFSLAFRHAFGCTPSEFRGLTRTRRIDFASRARALRPTEPAATGINEAEGGIRGRCRRNDRDREAVERDGVRSVGPGRHDTA